MCLILKCVDYVFKVKMLKVIYDMWIVYNMIVSCIGCCLLISFIKLCYIGFGIKN